MESRLDKKHRQKFEGSVVVKYLGAKEDKDAYLVNHPDKTERDYSWYNIMPTVLLELFLWFVVGVTAYFIVSTGFVDTGSLWQVEQVAPDAYFDSANN